MGRTEVKLNGTWSFYQAESKKKWNLTVPGTVLSGLLENGEIEDPFYRKNEYEIRELFWKDYYFERSFSIQNDFLMETEINLVCEGLDTLTEIYINGNLAAKTDNMHRTWKIPVKSLLHPGENQIQIKFCSVLNYIEHYEYRNADPICYHSTGVLPGNQLVRKAHSMLGWDWGPQLIDAGIFRDIYLCATTGAILENVRIHQELHMSEEGCKQADLSLFPEIHGELEAGQCLEISVKEEHGAVMKNETVQALSGEDILLCIEHPKLWWPNEYGSQPLYEVILSLKNPDGTIQNTITKRIGFRTLTISQKKDEWGSEFAVEINGIKIFAKGGDYIPEDCLYTRITKEKQEYLLQSCADAHFNMIRIWGGGYYPSEDFYDLCDHMGLIVWQDLMYACNIYDLTDEFEENIRQETYDNVKRLRHHASLGLWCGNNEIESAWEHWGDFKRQHPHYKADYIKMFEYILPKAVKESDPDTFYWASSPSSGGCFDNSGDENRGDNHYWDVWHGLRPFSDYRKYYFRFCSEFGFQSFPELKTIETFTKKEDRNIFSDVMESHQKNDAANGKILYYLSENFKYPKDFEHLLYVSQVLQALAITSGVEHWRRNMGRCMGTLYWQINDNWPVASWSSIDYFGRFKALQYAAGNFYKKTAVSIARTDNQMKVFIANDALEEQTYLGYVYLKDCHLDIIEKVPVKGTVAPLAATEIFEKDYSQLLEHLDKQSVFVEAEIMFADNTMQNRVEVFVPYKHLQLEKAPVYVDVREEDTRYRLKLSTTVFQAFVELSVKNADVIFSDNFFMMTDTKPLVIEVEKEKIRNGKIQNASDLKAQLSIRSLVDSYE